jgi:hypothetical protein
MRMLHFTALLVIMFQDPQTPPPAPPPGQPVPPKAPVLQDGSWTIVYAEINGRKLDVSKTNTATIQGDTLTYQHDGGSRTVRLEFGPNNTLRATRMPNPPATNPNTPAPLPSQPPAAAAPGANPPTALAGAETHGVYITSEEVLCICLYGNFAGGGDAVVPAGGVPLPNKPGDDPGSKRSGAGGQGVGNNTGGAGDPPPTGTDRDEQKRSGAGGQGTGNNTGGAGDPPPLPGGTSSPSTVKPGAGNVISQGKMVLILRKGTANR